MKEPGFWLRILNSDHEFFFRAPAQFKTDAAKRQYLQEWMDEICRHLQGSQGSQRRLPAPEKMVNFWKAEQMTTDQFMQQADTFDVILFQCNTGGGKIIRSYTRS